MVFTTISWDTGKWVDFHVASKYCHQCSVSKKRRQKGEVTEAEHKKWLQVMSVAKKLPNHLAWRGSSNSACCGSVLLSYWIALYYVH